MAALAKREGLSTKMLLTRRATSANVLEEIDRASRDLRAGDYFLLTYAGHGSWLPDQEGDEVDGRDETWCLYDRMVLDDELLERWNQFEPGVNIAVISDSCHSGTVIRALLRNPEKAEALTDLFGVSVTGPDHLLRVRTIDSETREYAYHNHQDLYDSIRPRSSARASGEPGASVLLISGCQDNQTSLDGDVNGLFTEKLLETWDEGQFQGGYVALHRAISRLMPPFQTPNLDRAGRRNAAFENRRPFSVTRSTRREQDEGNGNGHIPRCRIELDFPAGMPFRYSSESLDEYLRTGCCDVILDAFEKVEAVSIPRSGGVEVGCKADSKGDVSCEAKVSIKF